MATRPEIVDYIRTLIKGEHEANDRIESKLDATGWEGYATFLNAVFFYAIDRRFAGIRNDNAIIKFVAEMRTDIEGGGSEIDAATAEQVVTSVLDSTVEFTATPEMLAKIQTLATYKALTEENMSDAELDDLLAQAVQLADSPV